MVNNYKKVLTMDELVKFCKEQKLLSFSSKQAGYPLAVKVPTTFEIEENTDENHRGMMRLKFRIFHTGLNRNGSFVSENAAKKAMSTIADRPVLAAIHQLDDGTWDFEGHEIEVITNENGETEYNYIESQVGSFTSEPAFWEHDDKLDKDYVCAYAYISEEYTKAAEIIREKNGSKNSCELVIDELAYNAKENYLDLTEFYVNGSTLLGRKADGTEIGEGMLGSRADIADFSIENNSVCSNDNAIEVIEKIKDVLSNFSIDKNSGKEETQVEDLEKFEEVAEENIAMEEESTEGEATAENAEDATDVTPTEEVTEEFEADAETDANDDANNDANEESDDANSEEDEPSEDIAEFSVTLNGETKTFALSLNDKINALYNLVNETYGELDDDYYDVVVFEDTKTVEMHGWFRGKSYKQSYKTKKDDFSLVGDRVPISAVWMTDDEKAAFEKMKADFAVISDRLQKYEDEPKKSEILESTKYSYVAGTEEFKTLINDHFDISVEDLTKKADEILLEYAENGKLKFSTEIENKEEKVKSIQFNTGRKTVSRYGNLFNK